MRHKSSASAPPCHWGPMERGRTASARWGCGRPMLAQSTSSGPTPPSETFSVTGTVDAAAVQLRNEAGRRWATRRPSLTSGAVILPAMASLPGAPPGCGSVAWAPGPRLAGGSPRGTRHAAFRKEVPLWRRGPQRPPPRDLPRTSPALVLPPAEALDAHSKIHQLFPSSPLSSQRATRTCRTSPNRYPACRIDPVPPQRQV